MTSTTNTKLRNAKTSLTVKTNVKGGASVPHTYDCDKSAGFIMDPNEHKRVGYSTP